MADGAGRQANAGCNNTEGSYTCVCNTGYERSDAGIGTCVDVDECGSGAHSCEVSAVRGFADGGVKSVIGCLGFV